MILFLFLAGRLTPYAHFDEKKSDGSPYQFAQTNQQRHKYGCTGTNAEGCDGHKETALSTAQLQWYEEQEVSEKTGKGEDEDALHETDVRHQHEKDEVNLQRGDYPAHQFEKHSKDKRPGILTVKGRNL